MTVTGRVPDLENPFPTANAYGGPLDEGLKYFKRLYLGQVGVDHLWQANYIKRNKTCSCVRDRLVQNLIPTEITTRFRDLSLKLKYSCLTTRCTS